MGWGIAESASEKEKLKAESADFLSGLNSCGDITYSTYSEAFDFYSNLLENVFELGKSQNSETAESCQPPTTKVKTPAQKEPTPDGEICHCKHGDAWRELPRIISCTPCDFCPSCGGKILLT